MKFASNSSEGFAGALKGLAASGVHVLALAPTHNKDFETVATGEENLNYVALLGNVGSSFWETFDLSPERRDQIDDPLDSWSKRIFEEAFGHLNQQVQTVCPSDGPPYAPFQSWAFRSGSYSASPVGVAIHSSFGLWTAFRGAVLLPEPCFKIANTFREATLRLFDGNLDVSPQQTCDSCVEKPCLTTCPVSAFSAAMSVEGQKQGTHVVYEVEKCRRFVRLESERQSIAQGSCFTSACAARRACPVRPDLAVLTEQAQFHMQAFVNARPD